MRVILIKIVLIIVSLFTITAIAQTDWVKWRKAEISYEKKDLIRHKDYSYHDRSISGLAVKTLANAYWFFVSDLDGDNCPFSPTCSSFLLQSVKETNIVQGTLMFFDRFTRDYNFIERYNRYPRVEDGHYYDPISLYTLNVKKINYIPPSTVVKQ